jgi:hypothetical protein
MKRTIDLLCWNVHTCCRDERSTLPFRRTRIWDRRFRYRLFITLFT